MELAPVINWSDLGPSGHFVQFYEKDSFLEKGVSTFLGSGLGAGNCAIVIATRPHNAILEVLLARQGIDVAAVKARGQYMALDAAETLAKIMAQGMPDEALFNKVVGSVVARMEKTGGGIRAFGEMVALLWEEGNEAGAIMLEELWNKLAKKYAFQLFCAYPMGGFRGVGHEKAFAHICEAHSQVIPAESYAALERTAEERLAAIALLQQKAASLESEIAERKRAEEALRRSREELASFVEHAAVGLHWVAADGTILWANAADFEMLGYSREEYVGHNVAEFHADREVVQEILGRLGQGEKLHNFEARMKCKDGSLKTVHIDSSAYCENGHFVHTQCFTRDITEAKLAEAASRRLAAIVESSDDAIISKNLDGIITSWNQGAERIFGYAADEIIGKPVTVLIPPEHFNEEPEILNRIRRGERIEHYETVRRRKDGTLFDISLSVSPVKDGRDKITGASKIARDISDRKQAEQALQESELHLRQLANAMPQLVWEADAKGNILFCNDRRQGFLAEMHGNPNAITWQAIVHPDDFAETETVWKYSIEHKSGFEIEHRLGLRNGEYCWHLSRAILTYDENGSVRRWYGFSADIHAQKQAEAALRNSRIELEERVEERTAQLKASALELKYRNEQLTRLSSELTLTEQRERRRLAGLLHDHVQQLLVATLYRLQALRQRFDGNEIGPPIKQICEILNECLKVSRSLTVELFPPVLHEGGLAAGLQWLASNMQEKHGLEIELEMDPAAEPAREDLRILLFESVRELLFNIVKHADCKKARIELRLQPDNNLSLSVSDEGAGFDPASLWNGNGADSNGFGLFSIRERITLLRGRLEITSELGSGSRFTLVAPNGSLHKGNEIVAKSA